MLLSLLRTLNPLLSVVCCGIVKIDSILFQHTLSWKVYVAHIFTPDFLNYGLTCMNYVFWLF